MGWSEMEAEGEKIRDRKGKQKNRRQGVVADAGGSGQQIDGRDLSRVVVVF